MGIDMTLLAPSDTADVPALREALACMCSPVFAWICDGSWAVTDLVEITGMSRYFGNGITSGDWPMIRKVIVAARPHAPDLRPYGRVLTPEEDGRFSASIPEFPGCFAQGDSVAEAYTNLERVALSWLEHALDQGLVVQEPTVVRVKGPRS